MEFLDVVKNRHSCRKYFKREVKREDLIKIVEAGRLSPSGCNAQPWKFIIVDDEKKVEALKDALVVPSGDTGCAWRETVPAFIVCVETPASVLKMVKKYYGETQVFAHGDIGMAAMNMCYEAMDLGLDTCVIGMCDTDKVHDIFEIPQSRTIRLILAVGYGDEGGRIPEKVRKSFEEVCSFNNWE